MVRRRENYFSGLRVDALFFRPLAADKVFNLFEDTEVLESEWPCRDVARAISKIVLVMNKSLTPQKEAIL